MDDVHVLDLGPDENRVNPDWVARVSAALDEVEAAPAPRALVTTGSGEFFSAGFDLEWMAANPDGVTELVASMHELVARVLELPLPTVAALRGHAIAGGALLALAHDYRVMRDDQGYFWLPEIDGGIAISPGFTALVRARLAPQTAHEALTAGRPYSAAEAAQERIVDAVTPAEDVLPKAMSVAAELSTKPPTAYGTIKARLYGDVLATLRDRTANFADIGKFEAAFAAVGIKRPDA
jgi:enoyl-CoA hydratase/carnithine racemase